MERLFSVDEAGALLPELTRLLTELREAHQELLELVPAHRERIAGGNGSAGAASELSAAERRYVSVVREIEATGVVLRDPATGLVDFAATRGGQPVYLCWRLGEPSVAHWHPRDTGFMGRQPL